MKYHRSHNYDTFVRVADKDLLSQYFKGKGHPISPQEITPDRIHKLLDSITDEDAQAQLEDELLCLNDIADKSSERLNEIVERFGIKCDDEEAPQTTALRVYFHKDPEAFDVAYDLYICDARSDKLNHYPLPSDTFAFNDSTINAFKTEMQKYLKDHRKTDSCYIRDRIYQGKHYILIARGDNKKTVMELDGKKMRPRVYRPAREDVLVYNKEASVFSMSSGIRGKDEKEVYVRTFGKTILGLSKISKKVFSGASSLVNLKPILKKDFYSATDDIADVKLTEAYFIHFGTHETDIILKSDDVLLSMKETGITLKKHKLVSVRVDFFMKDRKRSVPVQLTTRGSTQLKQRKEKKVVEDYLRERKVLAF